MRLRNILPQTVQEAPPNPGDVAAAARGVLGKNPAAQATGAQSGFKSAIKTGAQGLGKAAGAGLDFVSGIAKNFSGANLAQYGTKSPETDKQYDDLLNSVMKSSLADSEKQLFQAAMTNMYQKGPNPKDQATFYTIAKRAGIEWSDIGADVKKQFALQQTFMPGAKDIAQMAKGLNAAQMDTLLKRIKDKLKNLGFTAAKKVKK